MFTGIEINGVRLPASKGQVYKLKQNSTLFDVGVPLGEYTMPISLEMDDVTMRALGLEHRINFKDKFERSACRLYNKGVFVRDALLVVEETGRQITGYLLTGMSTLAEQLRTTYIDDVDYGAAIVPGTTEAAMVAHMADTVNNPGNHNHVFASVVSRGFRESFVNQASFYKDEVVNMGYNGSFIENTEARVNDTPHVPFPKLWYVLKKIHEYFGYTLEWEMLSDTTFMNVVHVNNRALLDTVNMDGLIKLSGTTEVDLDGNVAGGVSTWDLPIKTLTGGASIALNFANYDNISLNSDSPLPLQNVDDAFDLSTGTMRVLSENMVMSIYMDVDLKRHLMGTAGLDPLTCNVDYNLFGMIELSIDGEVIASQLTSNCITQDDTAYTNYSIYRTGIVIPSDKVGKEIDFKFGVVLQNSYNEFFLVNYYARINNLQIRFESEEPYEKPSYEIDYANHLEHISCSDFLASIRNRFGAYVAEVDHNTKTVVYKQLRDVAKSLANKRFSLRDEQFTKKSVQQSHMWKYNFDSGEERFWSKFYNKTIGDADADITHNEYAFDLGPVFYEAHKNYLFIGSKVMSGISKSAANTEVVNYLAIYHGLRDRYDGTKYATVCSQNNVYDTGGWVNATPWGLQWREDDGLYAVFLEAFWKYFVEYMEIEFTVYPDVNEILNFKYDNVDFYHFMKFLVKEIDFEIGDAAMLPTKAVMVKLDV